MEDAAVENALAVAKIGTRRKEEAVLSIQYCHPKLIVERLCVKTTTTPASNIQGKMPRRFTEKPGKIALLQNAFEIHNACGRK
jgi:hypothetical protein